MEKSKDAYRFCVDCDTIIDFWKYDSIEDTDHEGHNIRMLTEEEYKEAVKDCKDRGCFDES